MPSADASITTQAAESSAEKPEAGCISVRLCPTVVMDDSRDKPGCGQRNPRYQTCTPPPAAAPPCPQIGVQLELRTQLQARDAVAVDVHQVKASDGHCNLQSLFRSPVASSQKRRLTPRF
jgi:hypothetical protein